MTAVSIGARYVLYKPSCGVADTARGKREPDEITDVQVSKLEAFVEGGGKETAERNSKNKNDTHSGHFFAYFWKCNVESLILP